MWRLEKDPYLSSAFANVTILDRAPDLDRMRATLERASIVFPRLRQRVAPVFGRLAPPKWEIDPHFDLDHHLKHISLGGRGTRADLYRLATSLFMDPFDRTRPLWEFVVIDGLRGGKAAMVQRLHHTITDGVGFDKGFISAYFVTDFDLQEAILEDALVLLHGPGETVGAALVADARTAGVCFTGSTAVARHINRALAAKDGAIVPLIAETGGINAMIVDSTALPEQVVDAVVTSAFRSAGQRCSALRLLLLHESVAEGVIEMLRGAMAELAVGDPAQLATDVGPVIDAEAFAGLRAQVERLKREARLIGQTPVSSTFERLIAPVAFELSAMAELKQEIFGPVLHVLRWRGEVDALIAQVNALGYGLTLGVQTRIDGRALRIAAAAHVGNVYVNRNMIGAVVGVQPFGGEGLSGTGPKAGGPHYLYRFCAEQTLTINTAAAGGNAELLAGPAPA